MPRVAEVVNRSLKADCTDFTCSFAHNVSFPGNLIKFSEILFCQNGRVWCVDLWNRTEILIDCHIAEGRKTSKSQQNHFLYQFAHNVSFPGNLWKFLEILFSQNGRVWCVNLWNRTEILLDCHIARG